MNKAIKEIFWVFFFFFAILFLGILIGMETKERRIFNEIISNGAELSIEVINQHTFITSLEVMANLMQTQDDLNDMGIGGAYIGSGRIVCLPDISYCLHEVGHAVDEFLGRPSGSREWELVIDGYVEQCNKEYIVGSWCKNLVNYSGVNGNPMNTLSFANSEDSFEYGGYGELYAQLFEISRLNFIPLPESIQLFYSMDWSE